MSGYCFRVPPLSAAKIEAQAAAFRRALGVTGDMFPLVEVVETSIPELWEDFSLEVLEEEEMGDAHGLTYPEHGVICLRTDVYYGFLAGNGRDRFTVAHELGHLVLHNGVGLARKMVEPTSLKAYENSEWQANTFAGALLIPEEAGIRLSDPADLAAACGVSFRAAEVRLSALRRRGRIR